MKVCTKCGETKPLAEYYKNCRAADGFRPDCKACANTRQKKYRIKNKLAIAAASKLYRDQNKVYLAQKAKEYRTDNTEKVKLARVKYYSENSEKIKKKSREYKVSNPAKVIAQGVLNRTIAAGKLYRPEECERCGSKCFPHGHHYDYSKPLEVIWLCVSCHMREHHSDGRLECTL